MGGWVNLPQGQGISLVPGLYAAVAEVKSNHSEADIRGLLASKGAIVDYKDNVTLTGQTPDSGYRFVATMLQVGTTGGSIPWSVPFPFSLADSSHLIEAWYESPGGGPGPSPLPPPADSGGAEWLWGLGVLGVLGGGLYLLRRKRRNQVR